MSCNKNLCDFDIKTKRDFLKWALKNHPDKGGNTALFQEINNCVEAGHFCGVETSKTEEIITTPKPPSTPTNKESSLYDIAQFKISDEAILKFRRWVKKPKDCVINALELIGILNNQIADLCRIMVGDKGLEIGQIEDIFTLLEPNYKWRFFRFTKLKTLADFTSEKLIPGNAIFCGYMGQEGHVFIIAKALDQNVMYIDPQINQICPLDESECLKFIDKKHAYFILQASPKN